MPLTVPQQYKLLGYETMDPSYIRHDYVSAKLARRLRVGAEVGPIGEVDGACIGMILLFIGRID